MSDLTPHRHYAFLNHSHIVAIGGGHGLGRVMSALSFIKERLTGIVTTTDNGGSTGRIRQQQGGIAWGDLRNCLNQIIIEPSTASALFEYRFSGNGELAGHNLGNLMLKALENMHVRPLDGVNLIRDLLHVKSHLIPMSETPVHLAASLGAGSSIVGEVGIDNLTEVPQSLFLVPLVQATPEAVQAISQADVIIFGPGSFLTSIMPPLLLADIATAIRLSSAKKIFIDNLGTELGAAAELSLEHRIEWIHHTVGAAVINGVITPIRKNSGFNAVPVSDLGNVKILEKRLNADDISYRHDRTLLAKAIDEMLEELEQT